MAATLGVNRTSLLQKPFVLLLCMVFTSLLIQLPTNGAMERRGFIGVGRGVDNYRARRLRPACRHHPAHLDAPGDDAVLSARLVLSAWNAADRRDRGAGVNIAMLPDRERVRAAARGVIQNGVSRLRLGIMADSSSEALHALDAWTEGLRLPKRMLTASDVAFYDSEHRPLQPSDSLMHRGPVYLRYTHASGADAADAAHETAYMKPHGASSRGVILFPEVPSGDFQMYGNLPLDLFDDVLDSAAIVERALERVSHRNQMIRSQTPQQSSNRSVEWRWLGR